MNTDPSKLWSKNFISVSASNFFLFMTFYFLLVTLPIYVVDHLNGEKSQAGLMTTAFLLSAIIIRPFAGRWIEGLGSRFVLVCSLILFLGTTLCYFLAHTIPALLLIRLLHGIGFGMATTAAGSIAASIVPNARRGEGMGYFILSSTIAMAMGPFLGLTIMQSFGVTVMLIVAVVSSAISLLTGLMIQLKKAPGNQATAAKDPFRWKNLFEASAIPIALTGAFFAIAYSAVLSFVSVYAKELGLGQMASYFFVVYALVLLVSRPYTGKWFDLYGANVIVYPAIVLFVIGLITLSIAHSPAIFLLAAAFAGLGWGTLFPTYQTIAIQASTPRRSAMATATFLSIFDIGIGLGSFLVGLAAAKVSFSHLYMYSSVYILCGAAIYYIMHGRTIGHTVKKEKSAH